MNEGNKVEKNEESYPKRRKEVGETVRGLQA
jgi:hypothetical protein